MFQHYLIVNIDKKEYICPYKFGDGSRLLDFGWSSGKTMTGLAILLADKGSDDLFSDNPIIGSWVGDRVVIAGTYADSDKFIPEEFKEKLFDKCLEMQQDRKVDEETKKRLAQENCNLSNLASFFFENISEKVIEVLEEIRR